MHSQLTLDTADLIDLIEKLIIVATIAVLTKVITGRPTGTTI